MKTYDHAGPDPETIRSHPWTVAASSARSRYYDLKKKPALIRTSLEDFRPWGDWAATETFYELLEWLNGPESSLESNDCAFEGPSSTTHRDSPKSLEATGRVMVLWRSLPHNLSRRNVDQLRLRLHRSLNEEDPGFELGAVGLTLTRVRFLNLPQSENGDSGFQLMISFWAWGDTEIEVMTNLERTLHNLAGALHIAGTERQKA